MAFRIEENGQFRGTTTFLDAQLNDDSVSNDHVELNAGIQAEKLEHQHRAIYAQESATTSADDTRVIHVVKGTAGTIMTIEAGSVVANVGDSTITVDLLNNGVSILTAAISLDSGDAAYALVAGIIDTDTLAADDVLEIEIDATIGTGTIGLGVFVYVDIFEDVS